MGAEVIVTIENGMAVVTFEQFDQPRDQIADFASILLQAIDSGERRQSRGRLAFVANELFVFHIVMSLQVRLGPEALLAQLAFEVFYIIMIFALLVSLQRPRVAKLFWARIATQQRF